MTRRGGAHLVWELEWWDLTGTCWCHGFTDGQLRQMNRSGHVESVVDIHRARHGYPHGWKPAEPVR